MNPTPKSQLQDEIDEAIDQAGQLCEGTRVDVPAAKSCREKLSILINRAHDARYADAKRLLENAVEDLDEKIARAQDD